MNTIIIAITVSIIALIVAAGYRLHRQYNPAINKDFQTAIDLAIKKLTKNDHSIALSIGIYKDGQSTVKGYGTIDQQHTKAPNASNVFQIASVSKLLTAALLQILCDEGLVTMESTLGELIGESVALSTTARKVTLRQLATHTSGFPRVPKPIMLKIIEASGSENFILNPFSYIKKSDIFEYLKTTQGQRKPGRFDYSNYGMGLLGHVLELIAGKDFEALVNEKLLAPLGMNNTAITLTPEMENNRVQGYTNAGTAALPWTFSALAGAGGFNSTLDDLLKFIQANIEQRSPLAQTLIAMHTPQASGTTGIGWMQPAFLDRWLGKQSFIWHNGMVGGFASYVSVDTKTKSGVVILCNKAIDVTALGMQLTRQARVQP